MDTGKRGRGRPPRISRASILEAALAVEADGEALSMKAVADRLGVQRPALYHHVPDRDALVAMVSSARIDEAIDEAWMPADDADWCTWLSAFAHAIRDAMLESPSLVGYQLLEGTPGHRQLAQIERLYEVLVRDGFDLAVAGHAVTMVGELAYCSARSVLVMRKQGAEPHRASVAGLLAESGAAQRYPLLSAAASHPYDADRQFGFDVEAVLAGVDVLRVRPRR